MQLTPRKCKKQVRHLPLREPAPLATAAKIIFPVEAAEIEEIDGLVSTLHACSRS
jgi:hypothetical protein